jgi:UDP-N-acetylmuramoyl-L-alanyl-D-glutamate--2,6-diaminopimelate ligase
LAGITDRSNVTVIVDRSRAIADVIAHANDADVILIAGKGHEDYQEVQGVRYPFSDQEHARLALIKRAATKESHS